ncbi:MAG: amidohydrolase family protein [Chloroflexi bacterium]|nr:amidohydrolase family protein [Chloroflexota bacterium]
MDGFIDVHHHVPSAEIAEAATQVGIPMAGAWTPETAMAAMDASGIAAAVLTPTVFVADVSDPEAAIPLHRATNDYLSGVAKRWPNRFGAFATLPLVDPDAARAELDRAIDDLGMDGVLLPSGVGPDLVGAERFDSVLAAMNERGAVIHLHPTKSHIGIPNLSPNIIDFPVETTRAIGSLLASGAFERYENLTWIMAHAGGCFPYIAGRVARSDGAEPFSTTAPRGVATYVSRMYFDVAVSCHPNAFPSLRTVTDTDHIVFGTDYPAFSREDVDEAMAFLVNEAGFTEDELDAIGSKNVQPLFPRLTAAMAAAG